MNICYIVGAGDFIGSFTPDKTDLVIAADGGYDALISHGVRCDLLVGDLDSIKEAPLGVELLRFPVEKDETDAHLCYLEGVRRGYREFCLFGATGGREDHTFAALSLLALARERGHKITLCKGNTRVFILKDESCTLHSRAGANISVFAFGARASGVFSEGLLYQLEDHTLTPLFPLGVSNSFAEDTATLRVERGMLLVFFDVLS